jgi:RNA-directed DNA polymerase
MEQGGLGTGRTPVPSAFLAGRCRVGFLDVLKRLFGGREPEGARGGGRLGVGELARRLGLEPAGILIEPTYRRFTIPKRWGERRIAAPSSELRKVQRRILRRLLGRLKCHPAAHGFEHGRSIVTNALPHVKKEVVVRMDLQRFFESVAAEKVERFFARVGWDAKASRLLTILCTLDGSLPQGAPTSPRLSNLVNFRLDARLSGLARKLGAAYTRYADDLTFSFEEDDPHAVHSLIHRVKQIVAGEGYRLHMKKKLHIRRRHDRQVVTGLVVNAGVALPRSTRRWLRAVEHRATSGREPTLAPAARAGWTSFRAMIERRR